MAEPPGSCPECGEQQPTGFWRDGWVEVLNRDGTVIGYQPCPACRTAQHQAWRQRALAARKRHQLPP